MCRVYGVCLVAAVMGLAAPLWPTMAVASRATLPIGEIEIASQRPDLRTPRMAQLGRSGGGSTAAMRSAGSRSSGSSGSGGVITSGPPPSPVSPSPSAPASQLGAPAPQAPAIAPLSPQLPSQFATGGATGSGNLALSPGSASEQAPSAPGGGGKSLAACMGFWDKATHMTKGEWRDACKRTMQEYPTVR
jgi:hypothetical protein